MGGSSRDPSPLSLPRKSSENFGEVPIIWKVEGARRSEILNPINTAYCASKTFLVERDETTNKSVLQGLQWDLLQLPAVRLSQIARASGTRWPAVMSGHLASPSTRLKIGIFIFLCWVQIFSGYFNLQRNTTMNN